MSAILRECGVVIAGITEQQQPQNKQQQEEENNTKSTRKDHRRGRERHRRAPKSAYEREQSDMDFETSMHDMYESLRVQNLSSSRHKKVIRTMKDFLPFLISEQAHVLQQQRYNAWLSIQSVKKTLQREFGLAEVRTSCGWAAVHLNATLMVLLKTLRKYTKAHSSGSGNRDGRDGGSSLFTSSAFLHGACVDISSQPSGIDFNDEYRIHLNPTDVPLQWIEVFESLDERMVSYMQAARGSLEDLQRDANAALAQGEAAIVRGHTCPAIGYRAFLQAMAHSNGRRTNEGDGWHKSVLEMMTLVVEDRHVDWRVLSSGSVQVIHMCGYGLFLVLLDTVANPVCGETQPLGSM